MKGKDLPDSLAEFKGVELLADKPPKAGEESLYDDIRMNAEVLSGDYPVSEVLEAALYGSKTLDDLMAEWNQKWASAQETFGVEVTADGVTAGGEGVADDAESGNEDADGEAAAE